MPRTRRPYSPEFREQVIESVRAGRTLEELAREYEPTETTIRCIELRSAASLSNEIRSLHEAEHSLADQMI